MSLALQAAVDKALIGGNHIASVLIGRMGGGDWPTTGDEIIAKYGVETYDIWCCWKALMSLSLVAQAEKPTT